MLFVNKIIGVLVVGLMCGKAMAEPTIKFKGSARLRHDTEERADGVKSRKRFRIRGRLQAYGTVNDQMDYKIAFKYGFAKS